MPSLVVRVVSLLAMASSFFMYLSGGQTCLEFIRKKSTGKVTLFPFVTACVSSTIWLKYGLLTGNVPIQIVNSFGSITQLLFIVIFYIYARDKANINRILLLGAAVLYTTLFYAKYLAPSDEMATYQLGILGVFIGIAMISSPLVSVIDVIRSKSTETMALPFIIGCFTASLTWGVYGFLIKDMFLVVPNVVGSLIGLFQISLFVLYPSERKPLDVQANGDLDLNTV